MKLYKSNCVNQPTGNQLHSWRKVNQEFVFLKCWAQITGKRNTLPHRRLINEFFVFKTWARKPTGDSFPKENTLLPRPLQQCVWIVCVVCLFFFFFWTRNKDGRKMYLHAFFTGKTKCLERTCTAYPILRNSVGHSQPWTESWPMKVTFCRK